MGSSPPTLELEENANKICLDVCLSLFLGVLLGEKTHVFC